MFRFVPASLGSMSFLCSVPHRGMSVSEQAQALFIDRFDGGGPAIVSVPGRVNLIGEHIDYHKLPLLPMAIQRRIAIAFRPRTDLLVRVHSSSYGEREFALEPSPNAGPPGDWMNYLKAALQAAQSRWRINRGIDAAIASWWRTVSRKPRSLARFASNTMRAERRRWKRLNRSGCHRFVRC